MEWFAETDHGNACTPSMYIGVVVIVPAEQFRGNDAAAPFPPSGHGSVTGHSLL
jgi:hypothetical protein